ncbi:MAG: hypothetical protein KGL39_34070 [Patescibacteria group bacterium]|nr:hypothetical protein [Patescibacteria group bacterium]
MGLGEQFEFEKTGRIEPENERLIMVKAPDSHIIKSHDSIDGPVMSHRGIVQAPSLACNVDGAVGQPAGNFNRVGRQVWTGQMMLVKVDKIVSRTLPPNA